MVTNKDSDPLPHMDDWINSLGRGKIFSALDANWGYWQVTIHPPNTLNTAFNSHLGLFEYLRMLFGMTNAPASFQTAQDIILSKFN